MKRNDAKLVYDIPVYNKIFPYMMRRRCDALVFHSLEIDVTKTVEYIKRYNSKYPEIRLKFFYVFCAALMRTFAMRPELNRFIERYHYWQRNELSMNFVVKESFSDESPETSNPLVFKPDMVLDDYVRVIDSYVESAKHTSENATYTDQMIGLFMHFPSWLIAFAVRVLGLLDKKGKAPSFLREADGLHTSVFVSNLGSIGITGSSPHHHLYEWGTTSVFVTLGSMERRREFDDEGNIISSKDVVKVGLTVDERITSGFYFVKSIGYFKHLLENPEELEKVPELPPPVLTRRQYKQKIKESKNAK